MKDTFLCLMLFLFLHAPLTFAQTSIIMDISPPTTSAARSQSGTQREEPISKMTCSTGSKVTLRSVSANPDLAQKLKAFMGGVEFAEGHSYERSLTGTRKDPAACAGFFGAIDLAGCQKYKPAGTSIFKVQNGEIQYLADGRSELVPITLNKICTDGVGKMSFQFHYDQTFLTVRAGPWDYTITVSKKSGRVYSDIKAVVLANGTNVSLNKSPIEVGPVHIRPYGHYPHEMAPQSNATR